MAWFVRRATFGAVAAAGAAVLVACSSNSSSPGPSSEMGGNANAGSAQTPPTTNSADVVAWLARGDYKSWHCEAAPHSARGPSVHAPYNRICSNTLISANAAGTDPWPTGAAAVKELYNAASDPAPEGYAVYVKTGPDVSGGTNWFYFERTQDGMVYADGKLGAPVCVDCHVAAGSDMAHTTSTGGRDYVYTPVP
jgi:hypothetical protein